MQLRVPPLGRVCSLGLSTFFACATLSVALAQEGAKIRVDGPRVQERIAKLQRFLVATHKGSTPLRLDADGIAGPKTLAALAPRLPKVKSAEASSNETVRVVTDSEIDKLMEAK